MSGPELAEIDKLLTTAPPTLREYIDVVTQGRYEWYQHAEILVENLQQVADGALGRLMVFMPPRHGKSFTVSELFPGYFLSRHPHKFVGLSAYGAELAQRFSRTARQAYREFGGAFADDSSAVKEWRTAKDGGLWATGVGGPLTGKGFHVGIVDDPVKNAEEAESETYQRKHREWYETTFRTRAEPDAAIVIVLTRWHERDLAGWLLQREPEVQEGWHILNFDAVRELPEPDFPESCTVEDDWRDEGEALCPERYPIDVLEDTRRSVGPRAWASLYQQRPRPREGSFFKYEWFEFVDAAPAQAKRIRYWDTAGTDGDGDYTAGVRMSEHNGVFYVEDVERGQWAPGRRDNVIVKTAGRDGRDVGIWLEQEAGVAGRDRTKATVSMLRGFNARAERPTGSKEVRADPFAAQAEVGNVRIVRGDWNTAFLDELCSFPLGAHDDQVDAASGAFAKLAIRGRSETVDFSWV